jgi:hypothetical protein
MSSLLMIGGMAECDDYGEITAWGKTALFFGAISFTSQQLNLDSSPWAVLKMR